MSGRQVLNLLLLMSTMAMAAPSAIATTWDIAADFDTASNPSNSGNGPWRYGYYTLPYFVLNVTYGGHSTFDPRCSVWSVGDGTYPTGYIAKNVSGSAFKDQLSTSPWWFGTAMEVNQVMFENAETEPGNGRFRQIAAEWTAPSDYAALKISAQFTGQGAYTYSNFQSSDVHVLYRGAPIFDGKLNGFYGTLANGCTDSTGGPSNIHTYDTVIYNVKAGDTIAFTTGNDGTPYYEQVGVGATITTDIGTTHNVTGTVSQAGGGAISGAKVYAVETTSVTTTDSAGGYTLDLAPGSYTIKATKQGYQGTTQSVDVTEQDEAGTDFSLYGDYWDLNEDYSLVAGNPNGQWSYAYKASNDFSTPYMYAFSTDDGQYPYQCWYGNGDWGWCGKNPTPYSAELWNFMHWEPWQTFLYNTDWQNGIRTLCRWTSPVAGNVRISAKFTGIVVEGETCPVRVIKNNASPCVFSGMVNGFAGRSVCGYSDSFGTAPVLTYSSVVAVSSNDTLDFQIGDSSQQACAVDATIYVIGDGTTRGTVRSNGGSVLSGATVSVDGTQTSATTASDGSYRLTLPEGTYNLTTTKTNYYATHTTGIGVMTHLTTTQDIVLTYVGDGTLTGTVRWPSGSAASGAGVSVDGTQTSATTASDGSYMLTLPAGTYNLTTTKSGYETHTSGVGIAANQTTTQDIVLHSGIKGTVKDCGGVGIPGVTISTNTGGYTAATGSDGTYTLEINTPATYDLTATKTNCLTAHRNGVYAADGTTSGQDFTMEQRWDASADFSTTANSGTWSYGLVSRTTGGFTLLTSQQTPSPGLSGWLSGGNAWAVKSYYGAGHNFDGIWMEDGSVALAPDTPCGQPSDMTSLRWTAPATGHYSLSVVFRGNCASNAAYVFVEENVAQGGPELFRGTLSGFAGKAANAYTDSLGTSPVKSFACFVSVNQGDTIDFGVNNGPDVCCNGDWIGVDASVARGYSGTVSGTVKYGSSGDYRVAGARVSVAGYCSTTTRTDGTYSLSLPVGTYTVTCGKSEFTNLQQSNVQVTQDGTTQEDFAFSAGRVFGTITGNITGNPPVSATVSTSDGAYTTFTGTDGGYEFILPSGTISVVAGSPGYYSQSTASFSLGNGGSEQRDLSLLPTDPHSSGVALPSAPEWSAPTGTPSVGDSFVSPFLGGIGPTSKDAPAIGEWDRTVEADESFVLTGARFSLREGAQLGTDTAVWVWADDGSGGILRQAKLWTVADNQITATLPSDIPNYAMCAVWVENEAGISSPVCINRTQADWIGPLGNAAAAGSTKRVFGRNISHAHGTTTSNVFVYIQPVAGGAFTSCSVSSANPYSVAFTVPSVSAGDYRLYVHNGSGGSYGWSGPLPLTIASAWSRNSRNQVVGSSYPSDDTAAIQSALNSAGAYADGGTVTLNAGNYKVSSKLTIPAGARLNGAGLNSTSLIVQGAQQNNYDCGVDLTGSHAALEGLTVQVVGSTYNPSSIWGIDADDCSLLDVRWASDSGSGSSYIASSWVWVNGERCEISGCDGYRQIEMADKADNWMHGTTLHGGLYYNTEAAIYGPGTRAVVEDNTVQTDWPHNGDNYNYMLGSGVVDTSVIPGGQDELYHMVWSKRMLLGGGGSNCYIANNLCNNVAVQDNRGEMILLHTGVGAWFGNVVSSDGTTVSLRTDGLVDPGNSSARAVSADEIMGGAAVPDTHWYGRPLDAPNWGACLSIIGGNGLGQVRRIVSHTRTSVIVDRPWRVQPDSSSRAVISFMYEGYLVYNNTMNAFPPLYDQWEVSASSTLQIGNGYRNASESNEFYRTRGGTAIIAMATGPSYWNDVRGDTASNCESGAIGVGWWGANPAGEVTLGNRIVDSTWNATGEYTKGASLS